VLDNPGETETDRAENRERLRKLRADRAAVEHQVAEIQAAGNRCVEVPTEEIVRELLAKLGDILIRAAGGQDEQAAAAARSVVRDLTGGRIIMSQQGEAKPHHGWLRAPFSSGCWMQCWDWRDRGSRRRGGDRLP